MLGSTVDAASDGSRICDENLVSSPRVWYLYQTSSTPDQIVQVSTCTAETHFDTAVTVFSDLCSNLECVDGRDGDQECDVGTEQHSTVSWRATAGERYYIQIHGCQQNNSGDSGLITTDTEPLDHDDTSSSSPARLYMYFSLHWAMLSLRTIIMLATHEI
jgi:hypothetical protein